MAENTEVFFADVPAGHWASAIIAEAAERELICGTGDGNFEPESVIGKAEFIGLVYGCISLPEGALTGESSIGAGNVALPLLGQAVRHAGQITLTPLPGPDSILTRQEMAAVINSVINSKEIMMTMQFIDLSSIFEDYSEVSDGFHNAFQTVYKLGIINGTSSDTLSPTAEVTRAQAATVLLRTVNLLESLGLG